MGNITRYNFQTTDILRDIKGRLEETIGVEVFCGDRPTNNKEQRSEMVVINLPYSIRQQGVYQNTYLKIELIVRDKSEGRTNIKRLEELSNKVIEMFPMSAEDSRWYTTRIPALVLQGKDSIGFSIWSFQAPMFINKSDTYNI